MKFTPFHSLLFLLLAVLAPCAATLRAQAPALPASTTGRFLSWEVATSGLYYRDASGYQEIDAPVFRAGQPTKFPGKGSIKLFEKITQEGREVYQPVHEFTPPADSDTFMVALVRKPPASRSPGESPFIALVIPTNEKVYPAHTFLVLNLSPAPAMVKVTETPQTLDPWSWKFLPVKPDRKYRVWAASALQLNGKWVTTSEEILSVRPDERGMMLITIAKKGIELMEGRTDGDQNSGFRPSVFGSTESAPTPPLPR